MSALDLPARRTALTLEADLPATARARAALADALADEGWDPDSTFDVLLAAGEAMANAVVHGSEPGASVEVEFAVTRQRAWFRVADHGRPGGQPPRRARRSPDITATCGRGLLLVGALAPLMRVAPAERGTEVMLEFAAAA